MFVWLVQCNRPSPLRLQIEECRWQLPHIAVQMKVMEAWHLGIPLVAAILTGGSTLHAAAYTPCVGSVIPLDISWPLRMSCIYASRLPEPYLVFPCDPGAAKIQSTVGG